jgi:dTMP kinase
MAGFFLSMEGPEGAGKSTQLALLAERLTAEGYAARRVREPGGTPLGDRLRAMLLAADGWTIDDRAEALLYSAARAQLVAEVIRPTLDAGHVVLSDRYLDSTLAYQGYGRGISLEDLEIVQRFAVRATLPDLTILLDLPVHLGLARKRAQDADAGEWNRFEAEAIAFHERVRAGYLALARREPQRWQVVDATQPPGAIQEHIWRVVASRDRSRPRGRSGGEDGSIRPAFTAGLARASVSPFRLPSAETPLPSPSIPPPFSARTPVRLMLASSVLEVDRHGLGPMAAARRRHGVTTGRMA